MIDIYHVAFILFGRCMQSTIYIYKFWFDFFFPFRDYEEGRDNMLDV